jgi:hypothetical protein
MIREIEYRTFDQLLDSVKLDFPTFDIENMIDNQTLIKMAQFTNSQLGLKLNPSKGKVLEIYNGKAKLPSDLYCLNFALLCGLETTYDLASTPYTYKTYDAGVIDGLKLAENEVLAKMVKQYTEVTDIVLGTNVINHNLGTNNVIVQAFDFSGNLLSFAITVVNYNRIIITSTSPTTLTNIKVIVIGSNSTYGIYCPAVENPVCPLEPEIIPIEVPTCPTLTCQPSGCNSLSYKTETKVKNYEHLVMLHLQKGKTITADEVQLNSQFLYTATVKNGYILTNFDEGVLFINYQGQMEDDEGNLLVMNHLLVNEYYEYTLKRRICENLIASGEKLTDLLNLIEARYKESRLQAFSFVRTPGFKEMYKVWQMNRKAMSIRYIDMFKSNTYYGR